jgi:hypothetical protein
MTLSVTTFSTMILSIRDLIVILSIRGLFVTLSIRGLFVTLSVSDSQHSA